MMAYLPEPCIFMTCVAKLLAKQPIILSAISYMTRRLESDIYLTSG